MADAENTSINRVCAVTGMLSPVRAPFSNVPRARTPVSEGVKLISVPAIGENTLLGVVDWYICALTVTEEPTRETAAVVLKNALNEVMVPARGTWRAKLESVPLAFVISIVVLNSVRFFVEQCRICHNKVYASKFISLWKTAMPPGQDRA